MSILDRFKSKKEKTGKPGKKPAVVGAEKLQRSDKTIRRKSESKSQSASGIRKIAKKERNIAHSTLIKPMVTEKSTGLGQFNKYVFKVHPQMNKSRIKSAVEDYYGVGVTSVNIVKIHPKKRIQGRTIGWKQGFKKAIVTLQAGDTIGVAEGV